MRLEPMINDQMPHDDNTPLSSRPPSYHSYVLRFWEERSAESAQTIWRFSLEDPLTDQRYGFPSLQALTAWLQSEMAMESKEQDNPV